MTFTVRTGSAALFAGAVVVAAGTLGGCSSDPRSVGSGITSRPSSSAEAPTEVGSVSVLDAKVTFYSRTLNGTTDIGMQETGSAFAKGTIVAPLLAQGLTTQEIYLALAPKGATAPAALVAAQADEAAWLHRSADVRYVTVDTSAFVQKSLTACENAILGTTPPDGSAYYWSNSPWSGYVGGACVYIDYPTTGTTCQKTTNWVISGGCNESASVHYQMDVWETYGSSCGSQYVIASVDVAPYYFYYWYWHNTGGAQYYVDGLPVGNRTCGALQYDLVQGYETWRGGAPIGSP